MLWEDATSEDTVSRLEGAVRGADGAALPTSPRPGKLRPKTLVKRPTSGQDSGARSEPAGLTLPPPPAAVFPHLSGPCLVTQSLLPLWSHDNLVPSCFPPPMPSSELSGGRPWLCPQPLAQWRGSVGKDRASRDARGQAQNIQRHSMSDPVVWQVTCWARRSRDRKKRAS